MLLTLFDSMPAIVAINRRSTPQKLNKGRNSYFFLLGSVGYNLLGEGLPSGRAEIFPPIDNDI